MSERRILLGESNGEWQRFDTITEAELKKRLKIIRVGCDPDLAIDILLRGVEGELLHGEGKEPEKPPHEPKCTCELCLKWRQGEPPTDEWESWVQRMPDWTDYDAYTYIRLIRQWFREMPKR